MKKRHQHGLFSIASRGVDVAKFRQNFVEAARVECFSATWLKAANVQGSARRCSPFVETNHHSHQAARNEVDLRHVEYQHAAATNERLFARCDRPRRRHRQGRFRETANAPPASPVARARRPTNRPGASEVRPWHYLPDSSSNCRMPAGVGVQRPVRTPAT